MEPKPQTETRVRRNDIYYVIMAISIALHLILHIRIKKYKIKTERSLRTSNDIDVHQKNYFFSRLEQMSASNFATSTIVFGTFIISNSAMSHVNSVHPSEIKEFPHYVIFYWSLATFNINAFSGAIWHFTRTPQLKKTIIRELKSALNFSNF